MKLYSNIGAYFILLVSFFGTIPKGYSADVTLKVPFVRSSDKKIDLLLHPDDNSFGINPYFPNVPVWLNSIFRKQNKPEIAQAAFIDDAAVVNEKIKKDPCAAELVKAVLSGRISKQLQDRMEIIFDPYEVEDAVVKHWAELHGQITLHWARRGFAVRHAERVMQLYRELLPKQKMIIDYLRADEQFFLQIYFVYPGVEYMERAQVAYVVGDKLDGANSCQLTNASLDKLAHIYLGFLRNYTAEY